MATTADIPCAAEVRPGPTDWSQSRLGRRLVLDRLARRTVTLGGAAIIAAILAILVVIAAEVYLLIRKPQAALLGEVASEIDVCPLAVGMDEYREVAYLVTETGVQFVPMSGEASPVPTKLAELNDAKVVAASSVGRGPFALGLSDGRVIPIEAKFNGSFVAGARRIEPELVAGEPMLQILDRYNREIIQVL